MFSVDVSMLADSLYSTEMEQGLSKGDGKAYPSWVSILTIHLPSLQHAMPFWRVSSHSDLMALHHALELEYL